MSLEYSIGITISVELLIIITLSVITACIYIKSRRNSTGYDILEQAVGNGDVLEPDGQDDSYYCNICDKPLASKWSMKKHLGTMAHQSKVWNSPLVRPFGSFRETDGKTTRRMLSQEKSSTSEALDNAIQYGDIQEPGRAGDYYYCNICRTKLKTRATMKAHLKSQLHKKQLSMRPSMKVLEEPVGNKTTVKNRVKVDGLSGPTDPESGNDAIPFGYKFRDSSTDPIKGNVYVFNVLNDRAGAEIDSQRIDATFTKRGYIVSHHENFTRQEMKEQIDRICKDKTLESSEALLFFILSHGTCLNIFKSELGEDIQLDTILRQISSKENVYIRDKPKVFFANYCQGENFETDSWTEPQPNRQEGLRNVIVLHAVNEGVKALRSKVNGTIFVKTLCELLDNPKEPKSLESFYFRLGVKMRENHGTTPVITKYMCKDFDI